MRKDKLSNPASLRGHPNATLYKGIEISSKCSWLYLLYEKEKYILKGYVSCNHAGFIKWRKMSPNNTQEDYNCQSEQRSCSCLFASLPCCSDFSGHSSTEQGEECKESYLTIKRQCQPSTELNFISSVPIMKFSKGERCTTARVEAVLCGPINGTLLLGLHNSTRAAAKWAKCWRASGAFQLIAGSSETLSILLLLAQQGR